MSKIETPRFASAVSGIRHVFIRNLELPAHIGVYRQEEGRTQPVRINVDLATDDLADAQDMLENVVDYHVIEKRIRVNAVGPGPTLKNPRQSDTDFNRQRDATILQRGADPADICAAVRYLLDAEAVTGQMLAVDGGQHLVWQTPDVQVSE